MNDKHNLFTESELKDIIDGLGRQKEMLQRNQKTWNPSMRHISYESEQRVDKLIKKCENILNAQVQARRGMNGHE